MVLEIFLDISDPWHDHEQQAGLTLKSLQITDTYGILLMAVQKNESTNNTYKRVGLLRNSESAFETWFCNESRGSFCDNIVKII